MMKFLKNKIKRWLLSDKELAKLEDHEEYLPKKFGESKSVTYEMKGILGDVLTTITKWPNGEGFNINTELSDNKGCTFSKQNFDLSDDELYCILEGLNELNFFN